MPKLILPRRKLLLGAASLLAAPAILRATQMPLTGAGSTAPPAASGLGLQTNCTGFWEFKTLSWLDSTGNGTTLTAGGTPTVTTGPGTNSAVAVGNGTDYLTATSNTFILNGGSSFSIQCWVNIAAPPGSPLLFNKWNGSFGADEWGWGTVFSGSNVWQFITSDTSTSLYTANSASSIATGSWIQLVGTYNSSGGAMVTYVNGSANGTGGTNTGTMQSTASAPLNVGRVPGNIIAGAVSVALCGFWKGRILSAGNVSSLYNSGSGLSWAAML